MRRRHPRLFRVDPTSRRPARRRSAGEIKLSSKVQRPPARALPRRVRATPGCRPRPLPPRRALPPTFGELISPPRALVSLCAGPPLQPADDLAATSPSTARSWVMLMPLEEMLQERRRVAGRRARVRGRRCHASRRCRSTGLVGPNFSRLCATQMEGMGCTEAVGLTVSTGWLGMARETPAPPSVCRALHVRFWPLGRDSACRRCKNWRPAA